MAHLLFESKPLPYILKPCCRIFYSTMLFILLNFILLLLLPNPTLQTKVTIASSDRVRDQPRWAAQICNNYIATQCCAPLDLEVPGVGRGWFRGTFAQFDQLPALSLYVSVWQAQGKGYTCDGPTVGDDVTDAEPTVLYNDADGVGIGGTWYTVWITGANKTVAAANSEVVYPDQIMYDGELYTAMHTVERLFHSPTGRLIFGHPFGTSILVFYAVEARRSC